MHCNAFHCISLHFIARRCISFHCIATTCNDATTSGLRRRPTSLGVRKKRGISLRPPAVLQELLSRDFDAACSLFTAAPNGHSLVRPYQVEANPAIEHAVAALYHKDLVHIISMVKHTGPDEEARLTATERVERGFGQDRG